MKDLEDLKSFAAWASFKNIDDPEFRMRRDAYVKALIDFREYFNTNREDIDSE